MGVTMLNLYYIRAAIEANTGQRLSFKKIKQYLVEEKLVTEQELKDNPLAHEFQGYGRYYFYTPETKNDYSVEVPKNPKSYLPYNHIEDFDDEI